MAADYIIRRGSHSYTTLVALDRALAAELEADLKEASQLAAAEIKELLTTVYARLEARHGRPARSSRSLFGTTPGRVTLARRTGEGLRSIKRSIRVVKNDKDVRGYITTGKMGIHETGGTIRSSNYMAIPTIYADRNYSDTFIRRSRRGNLFIFARDELGRARPIALLRKSVTIRARLGLAAEMERVETKARERIEGAVEKALAT